MRGSLSCTETHHIPHVFVTENTDLRSVNQSSKRGVEERCRGGAGGDECRGDL